MEVIFLSVPESLTQSKGGSYRITVENLTSKGIKELEDLQVGEEVSIVDRFGTHVGNGVAMMSASEINSRKRGIAVKITDSIYKTPRMEHLVEYILLFQTPNHRKL